MKTKTKIGKTRTTISRDVRGTRMVRALSREEFRGPAFWKLIGESASLVPFNAASSLGKNGADLVFFAKDKTHCVLVDCRVRSGGLSEPQSMLYLNQLARFLRDGEFPLRTATLVFLLPEANAMHQKLLATFTDTFRLPGAPLRNAMIRASIKTGGRRLARNAYSYPVELTYKEAKFELQIAVKVVDGSPLGPAPLMAPPLPAAVKPLPAAPAAPAPQPADPQMLRRLKDLLDEVVSLRSRDAWKKLGESPGLKRVSSTAREGADLVFVSKENAHCLLVDCHVADAGLDKARLATYFSQLAALREAKGLTFRTVSVVLLLPPKAPGRALLEELLGHASVLPLRKEVREVFEGSGLQVPAEEAGPNACRFAAHQPGGEELKVTVKVVEAPAGIF